MVKVTYLTHRSESYSLIKKNILLKKQKGNIKLYFDARGQCVLILLKIISNIKVEKFY